MLQHITSSYKLKIYYCDFNKLYSTSYGCILCNSSIDRINFLYYTVKTNIKEATKTPK